MKAPVIIMAGLLLSNVVYGESVQLGLSDHSVELRYASQVNEQGKTEASWMHHEDNGDLVGLGFYGTGDHQAFTAKIGGKLFLTDVDGPDGYGIALGGNVVWHVADKVSLEGGAHYAPDVTAFGDVEHLKEFYVQAAFQLMPSAQVFVGYRDVDVDIEDIGDVELHDGGYAGISVIF